jgi:hypothetical protein
VCALGRQSSIKEDLVMKAKRILTIAGITLFIVAMKIT